MLDESKNASWAYDAIMVDCPGPPLHEAVLAILQSNATHSTSVVKRINQ